MPDLIPGDGALARATCFTSELLVATPVFLVSSVLMTGMSARGRGVSGAQALAGALPQFTSRFAPILFAFTALPRELRGARWHCRHCSHPRWR